MESGRPLSVVRAGIRAVPAVKYALGIAGTAAALALAAAFFSSKQAAFLGAVGMIGLMTLLVVFASVAKLARGYMKYPALFVMWAILIIFVASTVLVTTSVFFDIPKSFPQLSQDLLGPNSTTSPSAETPVSQEVVAEEDNRSHEIEIIVESKHSGEQYTLKVFLGATIGYLSAQAQAVLDLSVEAETGAFYPFRVRWVVVDLLAREKWLDLPRSEKVELYGLFSSDEGIQFSRNQSDRLADFGIADGTTVRLFAVEDEAYYGGEPETTQTEADDEETPEDDF